MKPSSVIHAYQPRPGLLLLLLRLQLVWLHLLTLLMRPRSAAAVLGNPANPANRYDILQPSLLIDKLIDRMLSCCC